MAAAALAASSRGGLAAVRIAERELRRGQRASFPGRKIEPRASLDRWCLRRSGRAVRKASCRRSLGRHDLAWQMAVTVRSTPCGSRARPLYQ